MFPLTYAEKYLAGVFTTLERDGLALRWSDHGGESALRVEPIARVATDGALLSEVVTLTHRSVQFAGLSAQARSQLNRWAALGALVPGEGNAEGQWSTKVGIFSTDQVAAERLYAPLLCGQATIIGWHSQCLAQGLYKVEPNQGPLAHADEPARVDQSEFAAAKSMSDRLGLKGTLQEGSYSVEFPWEQPGVPGRTSLLWVRTAERHSLYGNGVLSTLELPVPVDVKNLPQLVDELNGWELGEPDLPPLFGAWCIGPRAPTFISFVPTLLCVPGLVMGLASWARARHARAQQWVQGRAGL